MNPSIEHLVGKPVQVYLAGNNDLSCTIFGVLGHTEGGKHYTLDTGHEHKLAFSTNIVLHVHENIIELKTKG